MELKELIEKALEYREKAYAPYSGFKVGAAVLTGSGKIYGGNNIENASFGATICAERTAIVKAVSEGEKTIEAVAIVSDQEDYIFPCGICRQVISEFGAGNMKILCGNNKGDYKIFELKELIPHAFNTFER